MALIWSELVEGILAAASGINFVEESELAFSSLTIDSLAISSLFLFGLY